MHQLKDEKWVADINITQDHDGGLSTARLLQNKYLKYYFYNQSEII